MVCHLGEFTEYWSLREKARTLREQATAGAERGRADEIRGALRTLRPGDVIHIPSAKRRGLAVVVSPGDGRPTVMTQDRAFRRVAPKDFDVAPQALTRIVLPTAAPRSGKFKTAVAQKLVTLDVKPPKGRGARPDPKAMARAESLERKAKAHPCAACPERATHERWAERWSRQRKQVEGLERRITGRTETLARQLDRVLNVLRDLDYVEEFELRPKGERLCRIYGEGDLLVGEALDSGVFADVSGPEMAALVSCLVFESRERGPRNMEWPTQSGRERYKAMRDLWLQVRRAEQRHQVELVRELDPGFAHLAFLWAEGRPLETVLSQTEMAPGDFVRTCKQLLDLLRQIELAAAPDVAANARAARDGLNRGVVAYTGL
jgi:ATP-dependent RNA helicase HelY